MAMDRYTAMTLIKRIASLYPNSAINDKDAREEYVKIFLGMNIKDANKALDICFENCKYAPTIADIREKYLRLTNNLNVNKTFYKSKCKKCNGIGVIKYTKLIDKIEYEFFATCICEAAKNYNPCMPSYSNIPSWELKREQPSEPIEVSELINATRQRIKSTFRTCPF